MVSSDDEETCAFDHTDKRHFLLYLGPKYEASKPPTRQ